MSTSADVYTHKEEGEREEEKGRERNRGMGGGRKGKERGTVPQPLFVSYIFMLL